MTTTNSAQDYRALLMNELRLRAQKNKAYSLRSMAKTLGVSAPYLSQVLNHKRTLSESLGVRFGRKLRWSEKKREVFGLLIKYERSRDEETKREISEQIDRLRDLDFLDLELDRFHIVSDWIHFAIAELTETNDFKYDIKWISRRLGVPQEQIQNAIARLLTSRILEEKDGTLRKISRFYRIQDVPSEAIQNFHTSNLKLAASAIEKQHFDVRDFSGTTVAVNPRDLPEIKGMIRDFRNKLNHFCSQRTDSKAIYQLSIQFFRLDRELK